VNFNCRPPIDSCKQRLTVNATYCSNKAIPADGMHISVLWLTLSEAAAVIWEKCCVRSTLSPSFLNQLHATTTSPLGKQHLVSNIWEAAWAPEPVWILCRKDVFPLLGIKPRLLSHSSCSCVTRLSNPSSSTEYHLSMKLYTKHESVM
jgi:hypothetical protein